MFDKLRVIAGLRARETGDRDGYREAVRQRSRSFNKLADGIRRPLASLPQAAVAERVLPAIEPQYAESLEIAMTEIGQQIDAIEPSQRSLQRYDREAGKIDKPVAAVLPAEAQSALADALAARRSAIEPALPAPGLTQRADAPPGPPR